MVTSHLNRHPSSHKVVPVSEYDFQSFNPKHKSEIHVLGILDLLPNSTSDCKKRNEYLVTIMKWIDQREEGNDENVKVITT